MERFLSLKWVCEIIFIEIDFENKTAEIQPKTARSSHHLFTFSEAQKRVKKIYQLFKEDKWASYFDIEINELRQILFTAYINSDKTLQQLKTDQL